MFLKISFREDPAAIIAKLRAKGASITGILSSKLTGLLFQLQAKIVSQKLSGQVLAVRSGALRSSVRVIPAEVQGTKVVGAVEAGSGPSAAYARVHEYGSSGRAWEVIGVKARALAFQLEGKQRFFARVSHPPLPQRSYLESSAQEFGPQLLAGLEEALRKAVKE